MLFTGNCSSTVADWFDSQHIHVCVPFCRKLAPTGSFLPPRDPSESEQTSDPANPSSAILRVSWVRTRPSTSWRDQPLLLAVRVVLADEGRQDVVEPKQDRDLTWLKAGISGAVVCPLTVNAGSGGHLGRPNRGIPWRGWGAIGDGLLAQFQLLYGGAEQLVKRSSGTSGSS